jgi:hypothetical protein
MRLPQSKNQINELPKKSHRIVIESVAIKNRGEKNYA